MTYSPQQVYGFARKAGFDPIGAAYLTGTAFAESSGDPKAVNPSGARGLLQFEPRTWQAANKAGCSIWDPLCQMKAALSLMGGKFNSGVWHSNWVVNWDAPAKKRGENAFKAVFPLSGSGNPLTNWLENNPSYGTPGLGGLQQGLDTLGGVKDATGSAIDNMTNAIAGIPGALGQMLKGLLSHVVLIAGILLVFLVLLKRLAS